MSEGKKAYEHTGKVTGFGSHEISPATEHRDRITGSPEERNEINVDERNREKQYGPRTHQDTRITSKEGTDPQQEDPLRQ